MNLYGFIIGIAIVIGINFFTKNNHVIPKNRENIFILCLLISAIFGARAYHVIDQWTFYQLNPQFILQTWHGGLAIYGALIAAAIYIYFFALFSKISFLSILNSIVPVLPLCQAIGRLGNFINHEIPTWWLEASLNLILYFLLKKSKSPSAHYLIGYGIIRFLTEFLRNDTWQINNLKIAQIVSLISILLGLLILKKSYRK